ncbi:F-box protein At5g10340-like [Solanum dulcamara]|uniref:F-box protein At5g10340-like n=1 Tax=Solanum dulcamara TaxID=45834 RepID=UPI00248519A4|nr:F-box protein At5g10340-like [Solanum dulcamara]
MVSSRLNMKNQIDFYHYSMDVPQLDSSSTASLVKSPVPINQLQMVSDIQYFSCNGIILISYTDDIIILWNPATRESRRIACPIRSNWDRTLPCCLYNFCYFPRINDYKIFRLGPKVVNGYMEMEIDIFSTKGNTWKSIGPFPPNYYFFGSSIVMVDGVVYMMAKRSENGDRASTIVRFCLEKEQFQEELLFPHMTERTTSVLCDLGEKLCLSRKLVDYHDYSMSSNHEFWLYTMKTNSWNKMLTIPNHYFWLTPLSFMKNGDILFQYYVNSGFVAYNSTTHKLKQVNVAGIRAGLYFRKAVTYVETLSSPNS